MARRRTKRRRTAPSERVASVVTRMADWAARELSSVQDGMRWVGKAGASVSAELLAAVGRGRPGDERGCDPEVATIRY